MKTAKRQVDFEFGGKRYRWLKALGVGGFGEVFRAELTDPVLNQSETVAIKISRIQNTDAQEPPDCQRRRFEQEGAILEAAARARRVHIVQLFNHGWLDPEARTQYILIMRDEHAQDLRTRMAAPLPLEEVEALAEQLMAALEWLHENTYYHRDLKPENILCVQSAGQLQFKLIDFGSARPAQSRFKTAVTGAYPATLRYLPPDAEGKPGDAATDFYALAIILWEGLFHEPPPGTPPWLWPIDASIPNVRSESFAQLSPMLERIGRLRDNTSSSSDPIPSNTPPSSVPWFFGAIGVAFGAALIILLARFL